MFLVRRLAVLLACASLGWAADPPKDDEALQVKKFIDAYKILEQNSADPFDVDQAFYQGAIPGMLRHLDPHSVFFDPGQFQQLQQMQASEQKGFGSIVSVLPGRVVVLQVMAGTPSEKAGMSPGDEILAVNNYRLDRLDGDQIVQLLSESRQKQAELVVRRPGNAQLIDLNLTPASLKAPSVERVFELQPGIGYIKVSGFEARTASDIHDAIEQLGGRNLKGLVIDLRNNPGGLMTAAIGTASFFLQPGPVVLSQKGRNVPETVEKVPADNRPYTFPLAVIVNGKTASASEIVSGALQDHDRATIVGEPSFGKGLVQSVYPLAEQTGLALTTALYYIPSGRSIQKAFNQQRAFDADGFELGATATHPNERTDFKTDSGRPVPGGGGIVPDVQVQPASLNDFTAVLEGSGAFTSFAAEYLRDHKIADGWEVPPQMLDQFQEWLSERRIQPDLRQWTANRDFIESRLKTEVYTLSMGVAKGDQVGAKSDMQIQKAIEAVLQPVTQAQAKRPAN